MKLTTNVFAVIVSLVFANAVLAADMSAEKEALIKVEIQNLVYAYAITRDSLDAEGHANLFAEDGSLILYGNTYTGRDVMRERVKSANTESVGMHHMTSGQITVIDDTHATGVQYMTLYTGPKGENYKEGEAIKISNFTVMGKYHDKYVLTDDGWKFAERRMEPLFRPE